MNGLLKIAEQMIIDRLLSNNPPLTGKTKTGFSLMAVSGFLFFIGAVFILYGLYLYLQKNYSADIAALLFGGSVCAVGIVAAIISVAILKYKQYRFERMKHEVLEGLESFFSIADEEIGDVVKDHPKSSIVAASVSGYALGQKIL